MIKNIGPFTYQFDWNKERFVFTLAFLIKQEGVIKHYWLLFNLSFGKGRNEASFKGYKKFFHLNWPQKVNEDYGSFKGFNYVKRIEAV